MRTRIGIVLAIVASSSVAVANSATYRVVGDESELFVHVGRAGLFKIFGHDHLIRGDGLGGHVRWNSAAPERSEFVVEVDAGSFVVADEDISDDDRAEVQATMESEALALSEHPMISFTSTRVDVEDADAGEYRLTIAGELALRGVRHELEVPVTLVHDPGDGKLVARGTFELESKQWGVPQISALGGSVKTKSELEVEFHIVAARE